MVLRVAVTGARGFLGTHLCRALRKMDLISVLTEIDRNGWNNEAFRDTMMSADVVFHLAGVNRADTEEEFYRGNVQLTQDVCAAMVRELRTGELPPLLVYASSKRAREDTHYGKTKFRAEQHISAAVSAGYIMADIVRLPNLFGPGARPHYNSFVTTCFYSAANGKPFKADENNDIELAHVSDAVDMFISCMMDYLALYKRMPEHVDAARKKDAIILYLLGNTVEADEVVKLITQMRDAPKGGHLPDMESDFIRKMYATYLSYLPESCLAHALEVQRDHRGSLATIMSSPHMGNVFVSTTNPGYARGGHYHTRKVERFIVLKGTAKVVMKNIYTWKETAYDLTGDSPTSLEIPTHTAHWLQNTGNDELVVLFWSSEPYDASDADTFMFKGDERDAIQNEA